MAFPVVRVCVTVVGLVQSSFLWARVRGYCCNYACVVTCGCSFTVLSGWGTLIGFWSVLVFSSAFFQRFFRGTVCLSSFVFPRAFFSIFFLEELEAFCCRLTLLPNSHVQVFVLCVLHSTTGRRTCFRPLQYQLFLFLRF